MSDRLTRDDIERLRQTYKDAIETFGRFDAVAIEEVVDLLPALLDAAQRGIECEEQTAKHDTINVAQYAYLKARIAGAKTPELDADLFAELVYMGYVFRDDDMVGVAPAGHAAVTAYDDPAAGGNGAQEGGRDADNR